MEKKRVIALGIATLSLLTASAVTSTVAWYTGSNYLAITDINIGLLDPKLSISVDDQHFFNKLKDEDLDKPAKFKSVSSIFSDEWIANKGERPIFKGGYASGSKYVCNQSSDSKDATGGYFCQEMFIKCDTNAYITLDAEQTNFRPDEKSNRALSEDEEFLNKMSAQYPNLSREQLKNKLYTDLNNVVKSLRLSILVLDSDSSDAYDDYGYYIIDQFKEQGNDTYYGGVLDTDDDGYFDTYKHKEILYGDIRSTDENKTVEECVVYDEPLSSPTTISEEYLTCFVAQNYAGDEKVNLLDSTDLEIAKENSYDLSEAEQTMLIPVTSSHSQHIVLSIYQEGWDKDNTDFVRYSHFFVNVLFKIAPVQPRF